ncbi:MAG: hypothetical protein ACI8XM_000681 [Haloarculaceae archaeon]|jgi:hypothetical protein
MGTVTTSLHEQAQSIFSNLGYDVSREGGELRAQRKWRIVQVTPMPEPRDPPSAGTLRCFVTWSEHVSALERRLQRSNLDYEWAIIGVRDGDDYDVARQFA